MTLAAWFNPQSARRDATYLNVTPSRKTAKRSTGSTYPVAYSASRAGYYNANATVVGPGGVRNVSISGYDPTAAAIAQAQAAAQNDAMIANTIERGRQNLDTLERSVIKDNTLLPGEWYGGQLVFDPSDGDIRKNYQITIQVGPDTHQIDIARERVSS